MISGLNNILKGVENIDWLSRSGKSLKEITEDVSDAATGSIGRGFRRATGSIQPLRKAALQAARRQQGLEHKLRKRARGLLDDLDDSEKEIFALLYKKGQEANDGKGRWWTDTDLDEAGEISGIKDMSRIKNTYKTFKADADLDYEMLNALEKRELSRLGFKANGDMIVKEVNSSIIDSEGFSRMIIKNGDEYITSSSISGADFKTKYLEQGYKIYEVHAGSANALGLDYTHFISKSVNLKEIPSYILPYAAGGRRAYTKGNAFVKIGFTFMQEGKKLNGWARTLVAGDNIKDLQKYADEVNTALELYKKYSNNSAALDTAIKQAGFEKFRVNSAEDLKALVRTKENPEGVLDANNKAKVLQSGEEYIYDNNFGKIYSDVGEVYDTAMQDLLNMRSKYFRGRTGLLDNINGDHTSIIDVQEIWEKTIKRASYNGTLGAVWQDWARFFKANFRSVLNMPADMSIDSVSELNLIMMAKVKDTVPDEWKAVADAAKRTQQSFMRLINTPTAADKVINNLWSKAVHGVVPRRWWDSTFVEKMIKTDPIKAAQALVFRAAMGVFNTAQLWKQALGITTAVSLDPKNGLRAVLSMPAVSIGYAVRNHPKLFNVVKHFGGMSADDFTGLIKFMDEHGTMNMLNSHATLPENYKAGDIDLIFANLGNTATYVVSDTAAFLAKGGVKGNVTDIVDYSDKLALSMTRVSNSQFQHGAIGRLLTQWMTYPMACVETMFNKTLTKSQRASFLAGQLMMWGIGGTVGGKHATNIYNFARDELGLSNDEANIVTDGLITSFAAEHGYDIREGMDVSGLIDNTFGIINVFNEEGFGAIPKIKAARAYTIITDVYKLVTDTLLPDTGVVDLANFFRNAAELTGTPTGIKNFSKGMLALNAKAFYDKYGEILKNDVTTTEAIMQIIGLGPVEARLRQDAYDVYEQELKEIEDLYEEYLGPTIKTLNTFNKTVMYNGKDDSYLKLAYERDRRWKELKAYVEEVRPQLVQNIVDKYFRDMSAGITPDAEGKNVHLKQIFREELVNRYKRRPR